MDLRFLARVLAMEPKEQKNEPRDGMHIFIQGELPKVRKNAPTFKASELPLFSRKINKR